VPDIPALLQPLKDRLAAATPGPWHPHDIAEVDQPRNHVHPDRPWWWVWQTSKLPYYGGVLKVEDYSEGKEGAIGEVTSGGDRNLTQQWADAQFIAHAPTDQAKLIAAIEAVAAPHQESHRDVEPWATGYKYTGHHCIEDGEQWPCDTIAALTQALGGDGA
jgi:hypothetical protein